MRPDSYALGLDYGTNSVRAVVVDCATGQLCGESVFNYPSGAKGVIIDPARPHLARQHPGDYITGFVRAAKQAVRNAASARGFSPDRIVGIGVDTTGSTPIPIAADGTPQHCWKTTVCR